MSHGEISAWHATTREPVRVRWRDGVITSLERAEVPPPRDQWIAPPLVDVQINGYAGIDFQRDDVTADELLAAARGLREAGCTRWMLTLITDEWPRLMARLRHVRALREASLELQHAIGGWHIEGPFLSAEPGFCGAHDPSHMRNPTEAHVRELREVTGHDSVLLTLAPERLDAIAAISLARSLGLTVSLGHTNAPQKRLVQAIKAGATGFTHLGNGCPRDLNRHDNILWRMLETPGLLVSLIPDAIHVSGLLFRLLHRELPVGSIYYTTDAMAAAGAPPGRYTLGPLVLEVGEEGIVRLPGSENFAGSALQPIEGVFRACEMLRCPWQDVWPGFSERPSRLVGWEHGIQAGRAADFCVLEVTPENQLLELKTFLAGRDFEPRRNANGRE